MCKKIFYFLTGILLAIDVNSVTASAASSVATVPDGMMELSLPHGKTSYLSLPLTRESTYTGMITEVTSNSISVDDTPAPFTTNLATASAPYFVKFLTGNEAGRVLLVDANTNNTVTLDTTDHTTGAAVALTATGFDVEAGDTFEIFPGDTLASVFGTGAAGCPLILSGGTTKSASDEVALYTTVGKPATAYYFNTVTGYWEETNSTANANNTIIYPYSAFTVARRSDHTDTALVLLGRVTPVAVATKTVSRASVYTSTHFAADVKLSQLKFGSNWLTGNSAATSDTLSVWDAVHGKFDTFFQKPDSTWRKFGDNVTDQSNFAIAAGTVTEIAKRKIVAGATAFLVSGLPYSLD
jgi:uncharacterized protein (TIGR02597 family)